MSKGRHLIVYEANTRTEESGTIKIPQEEQTEERTNKRDGDRAGEETTIKEPKADGEELGTVQGGENAPGETEGVGRASRNPTGGLGKEVSGDVLNHIVIPGVNTPAATVQYAREHYGSDVRNS